MMKRQLNILTAIIVCLCLVGCSAVPNAKITNVDSFTVAQALYENGASRTETTVNDMLGAAMSKDLEKKFPKLPKSGHSNFVTHRSVFPAPEVIHNNKKTTAKYDLSRGFDTLQCKDTITLYVQQSNETILSVKCETKHISFPVGILFHWLTPYKRDYRREQTLMINTTEYLQADHQAQIEWLGKWRPDSDSP